MPSQATVHQDDQTTFRLFKHLFGEWVALLGYDTEQMRKAHAGRFIEWCRAKWKENVTDKWPELETGLQLTSNTYVMAEQVLKNDWMIWQMIFVWWPALSLAGRAPLKHVPQFLHLSFTLGFPDGKIVQIAVPTQQVENVEQFKHDGPLTMLMRVQTGQVVETIMEHGIDALYDKYALEPKKG